MKVSSRNTRFQTWQTLLVNRTKRHRERAFVVQGVRPIDAAVRAGWSIRDVLYPPGRLSDWATGVLAAVPAATRFEVSEDLLAELGEKDEDVPELLLVADIGEDDLARLPTGPASLTLLLDRPTNPGNLGTILRSADALGATGVIVTGHAADVYDPKTVRASQGSLFAVPTVRLPAVADVVAWAESTDPLPRILGTDEAGERSLRETDLTGPLLMVIGNETVGLSVAAREMCQELVRIPMVGSASSLNAGVATSIVLYEAATQR